MAQTPPPPSHPPSNIQKPRKPRKPYEEIGAIFNGNEVKIRVPKSTSKSPKLTPSQLKLQQLCTCDDDESVCSETCGAGAAGDDNQLFFQIPDDICEATSNRNANNSELVYSKQERHKSLCNTCNVTPPDAPKGVKAHKVLHPNKDVFVLKIGKQTDEPNRTGNIEVELVTPRAPARPKPPTHACKDIQCEGPEVNCCMPCKQCRPCRKRRRLPPCCM
ncbi:uncharacterized protein LOC133516309 [Cydia pomonella]|uniref:uncharacterized protein LOC133516309 n=1 Tax=Cydia pomonella TaxID=82600 RepID=UPI002ADDC9DF|nr:uncharacterized protein LOC133516309 [Cydia pomonella]